MLVTVQPSALTGEILAPASKSSMQRACAAALLRTGETIIHHPGYSNDDKAALGVIRDLGAVVTSLADGSLRVVSKGAGHSAPGFRDAGRDWGDAMERLRPGSGGELRGERAGVAHVCAYHCAERRGDQGERGRQSADPADGFFRRNFPAAGDQGNIQ